MRRAQSSTTKVADWLTGAEFKNSARRLRGRQPTRRDEDGHVAGADLELALGALAHDRARIVALIFWNGGATRTSSLRGGGRDLMACCVVPAYVPAPPDLSPPPLTNQP